MARKDIPEYRIWKAMKARCYAPSNSNKHYQTAGIQVCDKWRNNFEAFYADMGPRPAKGYSIERVDNEGDYCPENCKWIPMNQQSKNRSSLLYYTHDGKTMYLKDWARYFGIKYTTLYQRIFRQGRSFEESIGGKPSET